MRSYLRWRAQSLACCYVRGYGPQPAPPRPAPSPQVYALLEALAPVVGLRVGLAAAQVGVAEEAAALVGGSSSSGASAAGSSAALLDAAMLRRVCVGLAAATQPPDSLAADAELAAEMDIEPDDAACLQSSPSTSGREQGHQHSHSRNHYSNPHPMSGVLWRQQRLPQLSSGVDILVATPGRLVAHCRSTTGFSLRHLRFLVVDETDRLLRQSYQVGGGRVGWGRGDRMFCTGLLRLVCDFTIDALPCTCRLHDKPST